MEILEYKNGMHYTSFSQYGPNTLLQWSMKLMSVELFDTFELHICNFKSFGVCF
jgi:hypothetical protein